MDAKREAELERHCREIYEEYKEAFAMIAEYDRKKEEEEKSGKACGFTADNL